jgi:Flp pilus assembly protein TadD
MFPSTHSPARNTGSEGLESKGKLKMQYRASRILSRAAWILIVSAYAFPQTAIDHFRHGRALGEAGHMEGAASEFREAIRLEPDYAEAHYFLALSLIAAPTERLDWLHAAD